MKPGLKSDRVTVRDIGIVTRHGTRLTQPLVKGGAVLLYHRRISCSPAMSALVREVPADI